MGLSFKVDWWLLLPILIINLIGIFVILSLDKTLVCSQLFFMAVGLISYLLVSQTDLHILQRFRYLLFILSLILLVITFVMGQVTRGSIRWIKIAGLNFQASEFVKPMLILFFSGIASQLNMQKFKNIGKYILLLILPGFLIFKQPDLGNTLVLMFIWLIILLASNIKWQYLLIGGLLFIALMPLVWHSLKPYQQQRVQTFIDPAYDPLGSGYHALQAMISVGSGKIMGKGFGGGTQSQLRFLPENHTDFIFASFAEDFGLLGSTVLLIIYAVLFLNILKIAKNTSNAFSQLTCLAVFGMIAFQTLVNIGMNIGIVPVTGITLPLFSFGGSSLVSTYIALGLVQAAANLGKDNSVIEIG